MKTYDSAEKRKKIRYHQKKKRQSDPRIEFCEKVFKRPLNDKEFIDIDFWYLYARHVNKQKEFTL